MKLFNMDFLGRLERMVRLVPRAQLGPMDAFTSAGRVTVNLQRQNSKENNQPLILSDKTGK
jgi:hypothetical protein